MEIIWDHESLDIKSYAMDNSKNSWTEIVIWNMTKDDTEAQSTAGTYCSGGYDHIFGDKPHSKVTGYLEKEKT